MLAGRPETAPSRVQYYTSIAGASDTVFLRGDPRRNWGGRTASCAFAGACLVGRTAETALAPKPLRATAPIATSLSKGVALPGRPDNGGRPSSKTTLFKVLSARAPSPHRARWRCGPSQVGTLSLPPAPPAPSDSTRSQKKRAGLRALRAHPPGRTLPVTAERRRQRELPPLQTPSSLGSTGSPSLVGPPAGPLGASVA